MNDETEILRIHREWIELEKSGNEEEILKFCSQDVVWLIPGFGALQGVEAVHSYLITQPATAIVSIVTSDVAIEISNELAVKRAKFCTTFMNGATEDKVTGTHLWTLRKDSEADQWQVTSVTWVVDAETS